MKKIIIRGVIVVVVLVLLGVLATHFFLDGAIKRGVETIAPKITKTDVKLNSVSLSILSGSGKIKGFLVGNPEGFKTPSAINVGSASLALQPRSLLSDKIVIKSIVVEAPEITFETDLKNVNLKKILANVEEAAGGGGEKKPSETKEPETKAGKKLQVDEFRITGGKVNVSVTALGGKSATVSLPEIQLKDLGKGSDGITPAELSKQVLAVVVQKAEEQATSVIGDLAKGAKDLTQDLGKTGANATEKATKGLGDLFKKKQ